MKIKSSEFVFSDQVEWEITGEGVKRQILGYNENLMQVIVDFKEGAVGTEHSHKHSQTSFVVCGVFEFKVGNEAHLVKAGDGIYIAPDVMHGVRCIESGRLLDSFSPVRLDFLGIEE